MTGTTPACFEPTIDYCVVKAPRFAFEKFQGADDTLTTRMKAVGEVMAVGRTFEESLGKALRSLETGRAGFGADGKGEETALDRRGALRRALAPHGRAHLLGGRGPAPRHERGRAARAHGYRHVLLQSHGRHGRRAGGPARVRPGGYGRRGLPNSEALRALRRRDRRAHRLRRAHGARLPQDPWRAPGLQDRGHLRGGVPHEDRLPLQDLRRRRVRGGVQRRARAPSSWAPAPTASARASSSTTAACTPATRWPTPGTRPSW